MRDKWHQCEQGRLHFLACPSGGSEVAPEAVQVVADRNMGLIAVGCWGPACQGLEQGLASLRIQGVLSPLLLSILPAACHLLMHFHPAHDKPNRCT